MGKGLIAVIVIIVLSVFALVLFGQYVGVKNTLVAKNETVKSAWSQVDIVLQRRADLIPNLVETVKGYMTYEKSTLEAVINARNAAQAGLKKAAADPSDAEACRRVGGRAAGRPSEDGAELGLEPLLYVIGQLATAGREQLDAVVGERVVGRRDHGRGDVTGG